jgi:hypothetical protein
LRPIYLLDTCIISEPVKPHPAAPFIDGMIASIAIANNMVLVTRNTADFAGIQSLMFENWFKN